MSTGAVFSGSTTTTETVKPKVAIDTNGNVFKVPDYTIKDILGAIPPECYERSLPLSLYYVIRDIACMLGFGYLCHKILYPLFIAETHIAVRFCFWFSYAFVQGLFGTGLWVLAHECGHQAFSDYGSVNDLVGWLIHSYLMVPYFSWKYSHRKHHKSTGHISKDMVFVPLKADAFKKKKGIIGELAEHSGDSPIVTLCDLLVQQLGGWIVYLATDVTGPERPGASKWTLNHFYPYSPLFEKRDALYILFSDLGVLTQLFVLHAWYQKFGGWSLFINWVAVYVWVNHWLVFITYLQHTDPTLPHYEASEWTFAKGAAATIDRKLAFIGPYLFHDIIETHVLHHYCSRIPFYNARKASEAIKKIMGDHYRFSGENMWVSLWKSSRSCQYVDGKDGVLMYRNINHIGVGTGEKKLE